MDRELIHRESLGRSAFIDGTSVAPIPDHDVLDGFDDLEVGLRLARSGRRGVRMLRIERCERNEDVRLVLSGRIEKMDVTELRRLIDEESRARAITLDLKEVRLVDREGVLFLAHCQSSGITLENASTYVREWIAKENTP